MHNSGGGGRGYVGPSPQTYSSGILLAAGLEGHRAGEGMEGLIMLGREESWPPTKWAPNG